MVQSRIALLIVLAAALLPGLAASSGEQTPEFPPDTSFASALYGSGDYSMAALEYMRLLHHAEDTLSTPLHAIRLARCWQELDRPGRALTLYRRISSGLESGDYASMASMGAGSVLEELGRDDEARPLFMKAARQASTARLQGTARVMAALSLGRSGDWSRAEAELEGLAAHRTAGPLAEGLLADVRRARNLPRRSPLACAGASALIPGLGQLVCGRSRDGLNALLTTAATGMLLYQSVREESVAGSVLSGWLFLSFYGGNVYGGYRSARRFNQAQLIGVYSSIGDRMSRWGGSR